jgi:hypothetical protein
MKHATQGMAAGLASLLLLSCSHQHSILDIRVSRSGSACLIEAGGSRFSDAGGANAELLAFARAWNGRSAVVRAERDAPYRCIGGTIYALQLAGFDRIRGPIWKPQAP